MNKAMIESYLRNLFGVVLALVVTAMTNAGVASPLELGAGDWLTVLNGVWAAAVPTLIRYLNSKDPAFGRVATAVAAEVTKKIDEAAKTVKTAEFNPKAKDGDGDGKVQDGTNHERPAPKAPAKKAAPKKTTPKK